MELRERKIGNKKVLDDVDDEYIDVDYSKSLSHLQSSHTNGQSTNNRTRKNNPVNYEIIDDTISNSSEE